jgi:hypothetical protein
MLPLRPPRRILDLWAAAKDALPAFSPRDEGSGLLFSRRLRAALRADARYFVEGGSGGLRHVTARGSRIQVTQILLDGLCAVPGPWGLVVVELGNRPREWVARSLPRSRVLEGLVTLRDLLADGGMDVAVFSADHGIEIFLDRWGVLEIRTGGWWEPRMRALLESRGFRRAGGQLPTRVNSRDSAGPGLEHSHRVARVCRELGLDSTDSTDPLASGSDPVIRP